MSCRWKANKIGKGQKKRVLHHNHNDHKRHPDELNMNIEQTCCQSLRLTRVEIRLPLYWRLPNVYVILSFLALFEHFQYRSKVLLYPLCFYATHLDGNLASKCKASLCPQFSCIPVWVKQILNSPNLSSEWDYDFDRMCKIFKTFDFVWL